MADGTQLVEFQQVDGSDTQQVILVRGIQMGRLECLNQANRMDWAAFNGAGTKVAVFDYEYAAKQQIILAFEIQAALKLLPLFEPEDAHGQRRE